MTRWWVAFGPPFPRQPPPHHQRVTTTCWCAPTVLPPLVNHHGPLCPLTTTTYTANESRQLVGGVHIVPPPLVGPMKVNKGQRQPTTTHEGQRGPTTWPQQQRDDELEMRHLFNCIFTYTTSETSSSTRYIHIIYCTCML